MKDFVFIAHDPGGFDAIYPVALDMSDSKDISVKCILTGRAADKHPLLRDTEDNVIGYLKGRIENNERFVLVTGTSWNSTFELECIRICKDGGIKTVSVLDYWCNYLDRFKYKDGYIFPDNIFVMDQLAFDEAAYEGVDRSIMHIVGNPGLDQYVCKKRKRKKVLFLSQPLSQLYGKEELGYDEFDAFHGVLDACKQLKLLPYLKFHPKETNEMKSLYGKYSVEGELDDIAGDYDVIIGMSTMGLLQSSLMGIPVISYEPGLLKEVCIINKLGITNGIFTYPDLLNQLKIITGMGIEKNLPFWFDGKSTERSVRKLMELGDD